MISVLYLYILDKDAMEYPGARFTRPFRLTLLISTLMLFFSISPILLLYSAGYRYDWHNGLLRETGSVSIDVLPTNATVYMNSVAVPDTMPVRLKSITSDTYHVKISAPGYYDWEKDLSVFNKQTSYIKDVQLIRKAVPTFLTPGHVTATAISPDAAFVVYSTAAGNQQKIWLWNTQAKTQLLLTTLALTQPPHIEWSAKGTRVLINNSTAPFTQALIINPLLPQRPPTDLSAKINNSITKIVWSDTTDGVVYFSSASTLYAYQTDSDQVRTVTALPYQDWFMAADALWTLETDTTTKGLSITKDVLGFNQVKNKVPWAQDDNNSDPTEWHVAAVRDDVALLNNGKGQMKIIYGENQFNVTGDTFFISPFNHWWLIWNQGELWTYAKGEKPYLLNRSGEPLVALYPLDNFNTLALGWNNRVTALFPYYLSYNTLMRAPVTAITADTKSRVMYFGSTIEKQEGLWSLAY